MSSILALQKELEHKDRMISVMDKQIERLQNDYMEAHSKYLSIMTELAQLTVKLSEIKDAVK